MERVVPRGSRAVTAMAKRTLILDRCTSLLATLVRGAARVEPGTDLPVVAAAAVVPAASSTDLWRDLDPAVGATWHLVPESVTDGLGARRS